MTARPHYCVDPADIVTAVDPDARRHHLAELFVRLRPSWHADAACVGQPLQWWFPQQGDPTERAKRVCRACPALLPRLAEAVADPSLDHGIRGGTGPTERRRLRAAGMGGGVATPVRPPTGTTPPPPLPSTAKFPATKFPNPSKEHR